MSIGVIISTYNNPLWLEKTLWGYFFQDYKDFEIIIADDGSGFETKIMIDKFRIKSKMKITHVWHEDNGFEKNKILNKAILASESEYLIFTDQDCIPRRDFVSTHMRFAKKGFFISGGYLRLNKKISEEIKTSDIKEQNIFSIKWLRDKGLKQTFKSLKLTKYKAISALMNHITPARASWNGCNSSTWKTDLLSVNGYNENMAYGGEDRELGERLINFGLNSTQLRYSAICVHLYHERPYKDMKKFTENDDYRKIVRKNKIKKTPFGIIKL